MELKPGESFVEVAIDLIHPKFDCAYHYRVPPEMSVPVLGSRVVVPFGRQTVGGWVVGFSQPPDGVQVKDLLKIAEDPPLPRDLLQLGRWMAEYYLHSLGEILKLMSSPDKPARLVKSRSGGQVTLPDREAVFTLSGEQNQALEQINRGLLQGGFQEFLLHGVTGSGKTEVYLRAAATALRQGRQVLYLVPEIALTPQAGYWFRRALGSQVAIWHSRLARSERYSIYQGILEGKLKILIGPRSAVFAPFQNLGLIIIDEEHDPSYKQQERPYYHAREVARQRALLNGSVLVLGSATPSLESYTAAVSGQIRLLQMKRRPLGRPLPVVTVVDMRNEKNRLGASLLSGYLKKQISLRLQRREQVILFLNRRGYAPLVFCHRCGQVLKCRNCSISLVYHRNTRLLHCHYCGAREPVPYACPGCGNTEGFAFLGSGLQRVEQELRELYPGAVLERLDLDTTRRKGSFDQILGRFSRRESDILLGTQMVTKGHDFPWVTLVGVLNADLSLHLPDFRSAERTYQQLTQVAGRAGRGQVPGEVVVQTYFPGHYSIIAACRRGYEYFYSEETRSRMYLNYPPYSALVRIRVVGRNDSEVKEVAWVIAEELRGSLPPEKVAVLGPAPAPIWRVKGNYRWQLMLRGDLDGSREVIRQSLQRIRKKTSDIIINVEMDPYGY